MRTRILRLVAFGALALAGLVAVNESAKANPYGRQYYGAWIYQNNCYYRNYYYQPYVSATYSYSVVYYYPTQPAYYYYYNPSTQVYWGRSPVKSDKPVYSLLKKEDRKKDLKDIPESAFPEPTEPPPIPDSKDNVKMELPPKDVPTFPKAEQK